MGPFNHYVDGFFTFFDHPTTSRRQFTYLLRLIYLRRHLTNHTANFLDAKTATISCVTRPVALQMHYVKLLAAANF